MLPCILYCSGTHPTLHHGRDTFRVPCAHAAAEAFVSSPALPSCASPPCYNPHLPPSTRTFLALWLPSGAGQDLMLVAGPEKSNSYLMEADTRAVHAVPSCKGPPGPCVSVGSRAFLLGQHGSATVSCFDPFVSCW